MAAFLSLCYAQTFQILSVSPARTIVIPNVATIHVSRVCVHTPDSNLTYQVQVATRPTGPWLDRLGFTARNGPVSCWNVPLQVSETNQFFVRARVI